MITKRQQLFGMAFTLALTILLVDRLFVLPRGAGAAHTAPEPVEPTHAVAVEPDDRPAPSKTRTVAERLEALCPRERLTQESLPDAFSLPDVWLAEVDPNGRLSGHVDRAAAFRQRYELLALAESNGKKVAFVNHHRLTVGAFLEGFQLTAIDDRSVTFIAKDGIRAVLRLKEGR